MNQLLLSSITFGALAAASIGSAATTLISDIQGEDAKSPVVNQTVTVTAQIIHVVPGDSPHSFFVMEEPSDRDDNPLTSEGLFIKAAETEKIPKVGDVVTLAGIVTEGANGTTIVSPQIVSFSDPIPVTPVAVTLPVSSTDQWASWESMLLSIEQPLTVTDTYNLGRYGQLTLSAGGRLMNPTNVVEPGAPAKALSNANELRRVTLDDGSSDQNPSPTPFLFTDSDPGPLVIGDEVSGLQGIVTRTNGAYVINPTADAQFEATRQRDLDPDVVGRLRVAGFNVLNLFNGDGQGGGFPTPRGADTREELQRQKAKLINAFIAMDADIIGIQEMENDDNGPNSSIAQFVDALNGKIGSGTYDYVRAPKLGSDAIRVGFIFDTSTVELVGEAKTTTATPFDFRRPPLAQTFREKSSGGVFTIANNHFKSKGCRGSEGANADQGDGQGCWNAERTQAATTLVKWLETDPTGSGDQDVLIIGDLNAYRLEDPVQRIVDHNYVDLVHQFQGDDAYTYVFYGQSGSLDHALASSTLVSQVVDAAPWNINADVPRVFDYNTEFNPVELYSPSIWRSSDHDPIVIGLELR